MSKPGAAAGSERSLHSSERKAAPAADQLWNAIEFSSRFPDLALELASVLKTAQRPARTEDKPAEEELKFPDLVPHDPRAFKAQTTPKEQKPAQTTEETSCSQPAESRLLPETEKKRWRASGSALRIMGGICAALCMKHKK